MSLRTELQRGRDGIPCMRHKLATRQWRQRQWAPARGAAKFPGEAECCDVCVWSRAMCLHSTGRPDGPRLPTPLRCTARMLALFLYMCLLVRGVMLARVPVACSFDPASQPPRRWAGPAAPAGGTLTHPSLPSGAATRMRANHGRAEHHARRRWRGAISSCHRSYRPLLLQPYSTYTSTAHDLPPIGLPGALSRPPPRRRDGLVRPWRVAHCPPKVLAQPHREVS